MNEILSIESAYVAIYCISEHTKNMVFDPEAKRIREKAIEELYAYIKSKRENK